MLEFCVPQEQLIRMNGVQILRCLRGITLKKILFVEDFDFRKMNSLRVQLLRLDLNASRDDTLTF